MSDRKNFNLEAQLGGDTDDMELIQRYGLDPNLAYTPHINDAIFDAVQKESISDMLRGGLSQKDAEKQALFHSNDARAYASRLRKEGLIS